MPASPSGGLWAVVMAGGTGTRFWPESREKTPKQFLPLFGRRTLFEETLDRIQAVIPKSRVIVVTQKRYESLASKLGKIPSSQIIGEPVGRNTAPCVALAASFIIKKDPNAVLAILASDHHIGKPAQFRKLLKLAGKTAQDSGMPVTFGIKPSSPHTGYGYLEIGAGKGVKTVKCFHEKPTLAKAKSFLKSGRFLWNSGMFVWRADRLLEATRKHLPEVFKIVTKTNRKNLAAIYPQMPSISIDYGLMEPLRGKILTLPADIDWCDLGGWLAFQEFWPKDKEGNVVQGKSVLITGSKGNLVRAGKRLTALVGVENLVIVDTEDALLIASKEKVESVRQIVSLLREQGLKQYL